MEPDIGMQIKLKRVSLRMTQRQAAKALGTYQYMVSLWETGEQKPTQEQRKRIDRFLKSEGKGN
jgi:DNA-binding transcriptional regulator YiaG